MSVLGPPVIKQQLQYLSDDDEDAGELATEPIKVQILNYCLLSAYYCGNSSVL